MISIKSDTTKQIKALVIMVVVLKAAAEALKTTNTIIKMA